MRIPPNPPSGPLPQFGGDSDKQAALDALDKMHEILRELESHAGQYGSCDVSKEQISSLQSALSKLHQALGGLKGSNLQALGATPTLLKSLDGAIQYISESAERGNGNAYDINSRRIALLSGTITDLQDELQ